jgi:hypothetical protein
MKKMVMAFTLVAAALAAPAQAAPDVSGNCTQRAYEIAQEIGATTAEYGQMAQMCVFGYQHAQTDQNKVTASLHETAEKVRTRTANGTLTPGAAKGAIAFIRMYSYGAAMGGMTQATLDQALH